jgi:ComF family protein
MSLLGAVVDLLFPPRCLACKNDLLPRAGVPFCAPCWQTVLLASEPRERLLRGGLELHAPFVYGGELAGAIRRAKQPGAAHVAAALGRLEALRAALRGVAASVDLVLPVPLHPRRLRARGHNQSAILARSLLRGSTLRYTTRALWRVLDTPQQAHLDREQRLASVRGAFRAAPGWVQGARTLLVDDVLTTGATALACHDALRAAGAASVVVLALARSHGVVTDVVP